MAFLPFDMDYLTNEMIDKAERELGETDEVKREAIIQIRALIKEDPKLSIPTDDNYLLEFLRARKFNVKRAFTLLQNYYHIKKSHNDVYGKPDLNGFKKNIRDKIINVLPYRDRDGAVLMVVQLYQWNVDEMKFGTFVHGITCALLACVDIHPATQVCGIKLIVDAKGMGLNYARHVSPRHLHLIARGLINSLPVRFKAIHCVNESYVLQYCWSILRLVLSEKIKNRMLFHSSNLASLHKHISPAILPEEYGGTLKYDNRFWVKKIDELEDRYFQLMRCGYKSRKASRDEI